MAKLKTYCLNLDGIYNVMVAASSQRAAAELIGTTVYMLRTWDAGFNDTDEALALSEPGQVFRKKAISGAWERWPPTGKAQATSSPPTEQQSAVSPPSDSAPADRQHKLAQLRETLALAVLEPLADARIWWQGVLHGRLIELEASGVLTADDCAAFADQVKEAFERCLPPANDD
ncbi:hypothetical protein [Pseudomonas sp.]|uniref:hypothetical protein n=1 Tax=Pseudomonas sp. TaxID=306 RepID=UPI0029106F59|nr:hypothetical protein [Pseudomonas sp.]MDU4254557.1 hypothetical protein [Pseudomonas sp.]